jgi:hypothetical protein
MKYTTQNSMRRLEPLSSGCTGPRAWFVIRSVHFQ